MRSSAPKASKLNILAGFTIGGDGYITKPFSLDSLNESTEVQTKAL